MPQAANSKRKSPLQHLIAGGCAGLVESSICHPLDTVKTMMQLQNNNNNNNPSNISTRRQSPLIEPFSTSSRVKKRGLSTSSIRRVTFPTIGHGPIGTARQIVQQDGFLSLYRGLTAVYTGIVPKMAIRFLTFEQYKDWLSVHTHLGRSTSATFTAGLAAGLTEAILVVTPAEVCKIRMQSQKKQFKNVFHAAYTIVRQEGLGALYKGIIPTMFRQGCNQAVNFTAYNWIKNRVLERQGKTELASWQTLMIGGVSGGMGPVVNNPVSIPSMSCDLQHVPLSLPESSLNSLVFFLWVW
jgi:solute carrier family 25 citrate transporter 1